VKDRNQLAGCGFWLAWLLGAAFVAEWLLL